MRFFFSTTVKCWVLLLLLCGSTQAQTLIIRQAYGQEGCRDARAVILRDGATGPLTFTLLYGGTAILGIDYTSNLTGTVSMSPTADSLEIILTPISDGITEPTEHVTFYITGGLLKTVAIYDGVTVYAGPDTMVCMESQATLGAPGKPGYTYHWSNFTMGNTGTFGIVDSTWMLAQPIFSLSNIAPLQYTYTVTATDTTGCSASDTVNIQFRVISASFSLPQQACTYQNVPMSYTGGPQQITTYHWAYSVAPAAVYDSAGSFNRVYWTAPGMYAVTMTVTDQYGCAESWIRDIIIKGPLAAPISAVPSQCFDQHVFTLHASPDSTFNGSALWTFSPDATPATTASLIPPAVTFTQAGTKMAVLEISQDGCTLKDTVLFDVLPQPALPVLSFDNDSTLTVSAANGPAIAQWSWFYGNAPLATTPDSTLHISQNGLYQVIATSTDGCVSDTAALQVLTVQTDGPAALNLRIYPNPTTGMLFLEGATEAAITLFSASGQQVLHADRTTTLDLSGLPAGVYLARIRTTSDTAYARITKK